MKFLLQKGTEACAWTPILLGGHAVRSPMAKGTHRKHASPGQRKGQAGLPGSRAPGLPAPSPNPVQKAEPALFRPPGRGPAAACALAWGAGRSLTGWGVVLSPSCRPAAGTAHPEEVPLPVGQCRGVRRRGHPIWGRGAVRPSGCVLDHTHRRAPGLPVHSPGDADAFQGAVRHAVSNLCPISGPHCLERADWGFSLVNTVIIL